VTKTGDKKSRRGLVTRTATRAGDRDDVERWTAIVKSGVKFN
jgi:hypothetical protein